MGFVPGALAQTQNDDYQPRGHLF